MMNTTQKDTLKKMFGAYKGDMQAFLRDIELELQTLTQPKKGSIPSAGPTIISLKDVSRTYNLHRKLAVHAVQNVSLEIAQGEIVALTGPSGSGKSTLMHLIGGLDRPSSGDITVRDQKVSSLGESDLAVYRNKSVGFVFQFFYLQPFLRVDRNIEVPLMFARTAPDERTPAINDAIQEVGLTDRATFLPKELSGGQMQRVAIARALVNKPAILLADEPTGNLDSKNSEAIMQLLQSIRDTQGTTIIVVTHDPRVASWADRIIRLEDGKVVS